MQNNYQCLSGSSSMHMISGMPPASTGTGTFIIAGPGSAIWHPEELDIFNFVYMLLSCEPALNDYHSFEYHDRVVVWLKNRLEADRKMEQRLAKSVMLVLGLLSAVALVITLVVYVFR